MEQRDQGESMQPLKNIFHQLTNSQRQASSGGGTTSQETQTNSEQLPESNQISCGICKDQGFIQHIRVYRIPPEKEEQLATLRERKPKLADYLRKVWTEDADFKLEPCQCTTMRKEKSWIAYCVNECGVSSEALQRQTFDSWRPEINRCDVKAYWAIRNLVTEGVKRWALVLGVPGTAKTHLLVAATGFLANAGKNVRYISTRALYDQLRDAEVNRNTYVQEIGYLQRQPILVLDDLGAERTTDFARDIIHSILDYRYENRLTTLIASNAPSVESFPPRLASRLSDATLVEIIRMEGTDARPRL